MASQRQSQEEGNDKNRLVAVKDNSKRRHGSLRQAEIRVIRSMMRGRRMNDIGFYIEPLLRKLQEELPTIIERHRQLFPGRIMMCALNGEFGGDESEDWSAEEFNANISPRREGKGQLLSGDHRFVTLENGVAFVSDIEFTDSSCWTRSRRFRLGAKVVQNNEANVIREGRSEAFVVKDKRGEPYKKHDYPSLDDEIWRLKKIAKDGKIHKQLLSYQVKTVKDLLRLYVTDPFSLQKKMGNIAKKSWDTIIEHAQLACRTDDENRYIYHYQTMALIFTSIYKLVEVSFDGGHNYRSLESLNSEEKRVVERAKQKAYENLRDLVAVETSAAGHGQPSTSTSFVGEEIMHNDHEQIMQLNSSCGLFNIIDDDGDAGSWNLNGSQIQLPNYVSPPSPWSMGLANPYGFGIPYGDHVGAADFSYHSSNNFLHYSSSTGKRKSTVWNKIRNALKLVIPFVAKSRKAKLSIPCKDVAITL
ncbi:calmodulin-binding protein 60 G-like [Senna tora]|uniref:Calmodulin-binding protein 60 G-like n=1 Tax=Senna tora TaxID=362788 RepID=A0A834SQ43_9FABA|nr:calmodulin-binding protein 60 G-like [Senna tora]